MDKVNYQYKRWTMQRKQELMYNTQMKIKSDKKSNKTKRAQSNRRCCPKRSKSVFIQLSNEQSAVRYDLS